MLTKIGDNIMNKEQIENTTMNVGFENADEIFSNILDDFPELDEHDLRRSSLILGLMTNCIHYLHTTGWSEKRLVAEVFDHCEIAKKRYGDKE
jgi:hypothetical protein